MLKRTTDTSSKSLGLLSRKQYHVLQGIIVCFLYLRELQQAEVLQGRTNTSTTEKKKKKGKQLQARLESFPHDTCLEWLPCYPSRYQHLNMPASLACLRHQEHGLVVHVTIPQSKCAKGAGTVKSPWK